MVNDWAGPEAGLFLALQVQTTLDFVGPGRSAVCFFKGPDNPIFSRRVNETVGDCGCRIRIRTDARFPNYGAVGLVQAIKIASFGANKNLSADDCGTALDRSGERLFIHDGAVCEIETVIEAVFAANVDAVVDYRRRGICFKSRLDFPNQRAVVCIQTIDAVVEVTDDKTIPGNRR